MRGYPFLNLLIALIVSGAVLLPLVWRATRVNAAPAPAAMEDAAPAGRVPSHLSLRFVHAPAKVVLTTGDAVLHEWTAPGDTRLLEESVALPLSDDRAEFRVQITWPAGTPETNVVLQVEPDGREVRKEIVWSSGGAADQFITLTWKP